MTLDDIFLIAADNFADDVEEDGDDVIIYTKQENLAKARNGLHAGGLSVKEGRLFWKPKSTNSITDPEQAEKAIRFVEIIEELDDVDHVYVNFDIDDSVADSIIDK
jgi:transcriptional/translational regulatory protein YebC/TACO1